MAKLKSIIVQEMRRGTSVHSLSRAIALGILLGLFPVLGVTTLFTLLLGRWLGLNIPAMMVANYAVAPVQIALIYVLIKSGEFLFAIDSGLDYAYFKELTSHSYRETMERLWLSILASIAAWVPLATILYYPLYFMSRVLIGRFYRGRKNDINVHA
jgi:uncharacterized protein (DUF2062 family)